MRRRIRIGEENRKRGRREAGRYRRGSKKDKRVRRTIKGKSGGIKHVNVFKIYFCCPSSSETHHILRILVIDNY
jgi:hypothetical protein